MNASRTSAIDVATRWIIFALLIAYTLYNVGPIFWLVLSSLKSRLDLFSMPPKLFFTPDLSGYQSVFGVGAAKDSASAVGVPDFLDEWISSPYPDQKRDRQLLLEGFEALDGLAGKRGGTAFVSLPKEDQLAICRELAKAAKSTPKEFPASFFLRLRDLVAGGFYTTPAGMHDLGYRGNIPSIEWTGPPPEVLEALGLTAQA